METQISFSMLFAFHWAFCCCYPSRRLAVSREAAGNFKAQSLGIIFLLNVSGGKFWVTSQHSTSWDHPLLSYTCCWETKWVNIWLRWTRYLIIYLFLFRLFSNSGKHRSGVRFLLFLMKIYILEEEKAFWGSIGIYKFTILCLNSSPVCNQNETLSGGSAQNHRMAWLGSDLKAHLIPNHQTIRCSRNVNVYIHVAILLQWFLVIHH